MRLSHDSNIWNSRSPNCASMFSSRNTAATFSSRTEPENNLSATLTRKLRSCSRKISRRQRRTARRRSPVYQPCDLISSLKNHCTPAACSADPPPLSASLICAATFAGLILCEGIACKQYQKGGLLRFRSCCRHKLRRKLRRARRRSSARGPEELVIHPQRRCGRQSDPGDPKPDHLRLVLDFSEMMK